MGSKEPIELTVEYLAHTQKAILVKDPKTEIEAWIPRSQIDEDYDEKFLDGLEKGDEIDITIPEWLAKDKELY
jgi:ribosome assembly protein YihI (activator of Der GTPase)